MKERGWDQDDGSPPPSLSFLYPNQNLVLFFSTNIFSMNAKIWKPFCLELCAAFKVVKIVYNYWKTFQPYQYLLYRLLMHSYKLEVIMMRDFLSKKNIVGVTNKKAPYILCLDVVINRRFRHSVCQERTRKLTSRWKYQNIFDSSAFQTVEKINTPSEGHDTGRNSLTRAWHENDTTLPQKYIKQ